MQDFGVNKLGVSKNCMQDWDDIQVSAKYVYSVWVSTKTVCNIVCMQCLSVSNNKDCMQCLGVYQNACSIGVTWQCQHVTP